MPDMNQKLDRFTAKILAEAADESKRALAEVKRRRELRLQEAEDAALKEARVEMKVFYGPPGGPGRLRAPNPPDLPGGGLPPGRPDRRVPRSGPAGGLLL